MPRSKVFHLYLMTVIGLAESQALAGEVPARPPIRRDQFGDSLPRCALARMGTVRLRHGDDINTLAFSPDGKVLASGGGSQVDRDIHLWDPDTGKLMRLLVGHTRPITSLSFSPDGRLLASLDDDRSLLVWEVSIGRSLHFDRKHVWSIAFAPDGKSLALGCNDGVICIMDAHTGKETHRIRGGKQTVCSIAYSPDRGLLASAEYNDVIRLWDTTSRKILHQWTVDRGGEHLAFSPDGKTLASWGSSSAVHLFSIPSARPLGRLLPKSRELVRAGVFSPDGRFFAIVDDLTCHLWDMTGRKELSVSWDTGRLLRAAAFTPDSKRLALAGKDHSIRFWNTATTRECPPSPGGHLRPICALAVSLDSSWVVSADETDNGTIRVWDLNNGKQLRMFQTGSPVGALALSPSGDTLISASYYTLRCWDPDNGRQQRQLVSHTGPLSGPSPPHYLSFSADGEHLLVHCYSGGLCYLDARNDKPTREIRKDFQYAALSPDGKTVAAIVPAYVPDQVQFWDLSTGKKRYGRTAEGVDLHCIVFSSDGRLLVTGELLWDVEEGKLVRRFLGAGGSDYSIYSAAFSPDGKMLVTGTGCGVVQLWEVETGKERRRLIGHRGIVHAVAFCRSGHAVVSGSEDTSLLVWDMAGQISLDAKHRANLTIEQLNDLWLSLGDADARKAYDALCTLAASPSGVPGFALRRIRSSFQYKRDQVEKWIAQLEADQFAVRESASRKLKQLGDRAGPALILALKGSSSLEQRRRLQELLDHINTSDPPPDRILALRTIELLEHIGTADAKVGLQTIANESPAPTIRRNAEAALLRIGKANKRGKKGLEMHRSD